MKPQTVWAHRLFFPAACLYATIAVPLSVYAMTSGAGWPVALLGQGHGFEMLFGFSLAVVAGYTLGPTEPGFLRALFAVWLLARIAQFWSPFSPATLSISVLFGLALAWRIVPRFVAAKKWRNKLLMPLLGGLCVLPAAYLVAQQSEAAMLPRLVLYETVLFLSLLMAFMGGRIIAPAAAGELYKQGYNLEARVQPRIEAAFILLLMIAAPALALPGGAVVAGTMLILAGILVVFRLLRWQLWRWRSRLDLVALGVGYAWLGIGIGLFGVAIASGSRTAAALHILTVGALGTLTSGVMARTHYQRTQRSSPPGILSVWMAGCIAIAALGRVLADLYTGVPKIGLLWLAASAWASCFGVLFWRFLVERLQSLQSRDETKTV
ncbi:MAG: NnrS family protein [Halioglobus sp.]